jgi:hypothetical protein
MRDTPAAEVTPATGRYHARESAMPIDVYDDMPDPPPNPRRRPRPYIAIFFECCKVYARVYRQPHERTYRGRCPRCLRTFKVRVGPDGTPARFFRAR